MSVTGESQRAYRAKLDAMYERRENGEDDAPDWSEIDELKADLNEDDAESMDALAAFLNPDSLPLDHGEVVRWLLSLVERSGRTVHR